MVSIVGFSLVLCLFFIRVDNAASQTAAPGSSDGQLEQRLLAILNNFKPCEGRHHHRDSDESGSSEEASCKCKLRHHRHHKPKHSSGSSEELTTTEKPSDPSSNTTCPACPAEKICPAAPSCPACPTQEPKTCPVCPTVAPAQLTTCPACPAAPSCPPTATCSPAPKCATCPPEKICPTAPACPALPTQPPKTTCDDGWKYWNTTNFCYFLGNKPVNATEAQKSCRSQGGDLVSIHSDAENAFVFEALNATKNATSTWIGLYRNGPKTTDFANYDGTPVDYLKWDVGEPNSDGGTAYAVEMFANEIPANRHDQGWNDRPTSYQEQFYVCKKLANKL